MLKLRKLADSDIDTVKNWMLQDYVAEWFGDVADWMEELYGRHDAYAFIKHFIAQENGMPVGFCQYYDWHKAYANGNSEPAGTFGIDYMIGERAYLGKGLGKQIIQIICDQVTADERHVFQLIADPTIEEERTNIASIKALEACGFCFDASVGLYRKTI